MYLNKIFDQKLLLTTGLVILSSTILAWCVATIESRILVFGLMVLIFGLMMSTIFIQGGYLKESLLILIPVVGSMNADLPLTNQPGSGVTDASILIVDVLLIIAVIYLVFFQPDFVKERYQPLIQKFLLLYVFFLLWGGGTIFASVDYLAAAGRFLIYFRGFVLVSVILALVRTKRDLKVLLVGISFLILLHGVVGILQWLNGGPLPVPYLTQMGQITFNNESYLRFLEARGDSVEIAGVTLSGLYVSGLMGTTYRLAFIFNMFVPLWLAIVLVKADFKAIIKQISFVVFILSIVLIVFSLSRGSWVATVVGLATLIFMIFIKEGKTITKFQIIGIPFLLLTCIGSIYYVFSGIFGVRLTVTEVVTTTSIRTGLMQEAIQVVVQNPVWGVGIGNYGVETIDGINQIVHNLFLIILTEMGLIGLLLYIAMIIIVSVAFIRVFFHGDSHTSLQYITAGAFAGILATLSHSLFDWLMLKSNTSFIFWLVVSLPLIVYQITSPKKQQISHSLNRYSDAIGRSEKLRTELYD